MFRLRIAFVLAAGLLAGSLWASEQVWTGRSLSDYLEYLSGQGHRIIYSSSLVTDELKLAAEPSLDTTLESFFKTLKPLGLNVTEGPDGYWLIVEAETVNTQQADEPKKIMAPPALPEIVVSSSVYNIRYQTNSSHTFLDREFAAGLPDVGEEALSVVARVPGVASDGVSARSHVRGGALNEQLILFDGLRLYEPFHMKDFHTTSSIIDQRSIDGIDLHTAGYPARYGDRMSGVIDMGLRERPTERQTELGLSFFTTSALSMGRFGTGDKGDWLVSARRGNLDLIARAIRKEYGQPRYEDLFAHLGWEWSDRTDIAANFLYSRDKIEIAQLDGSEDALARYQNNTGWLKIDTDWTGELTSSTILSASNIKNSRRGQTNIPETVSGIASDSRDFSIIGLKQDWQFDASERWSFQSGFEFKLLDSNYRYESSLEIFEPFDQIFDNVPYRERSLREAPEGEQYAVYSEARWQATDKLIFDLGFRWDRQTYSGSDTNEQRSPRFNVLYLLGSRTELRAGFGRFYQAQEINELQYKDGEVRYFPPQFADHVVVSLAHQFRNDFDLRLELYQKSYDSLMPRFENAFDSLVLLPELQIDRVRIDADDAIVRGAEITLTGSTKHLTNWWVSYVWSSAEDSVADENVRRSWNQKHAIRGGISTRWGQWDVSAAATWHSGWPKTELYLETIPDGVGGTELIAVTSPRNSLNYETYHTLDMRVGRTFQLNNSELDAFLEISNLYNRENQCCLTYRQLTDAGGNAVLQREQESWLPLVPSLGVVWRF